MHSNTDRNDFLVIINHKNLMCQMLNDCIKSVKREKILMVMVGLNLHPDNNIAAI